MGVTRVCVWTCAVLALFFMQENMKTLKRCDYSPLLLSNRLPEMYLNNPKSDFELFTFLLNEQSLRHLFLSRTHGDACAMFTAFMQLKLINYITASFKVGSYPAKLRATSRFTGFTGFSGTERRRLYTRYAR
jgi:hypothetical protein